MLAGVFLRHYKIYKNINFIPISTGSGLSAFLGQNGAGKSSILDALDKYFNGGDWSINSNAKSEGGLAGEDKALYIVPVFVIKKEDLSGDEKEIAEILSEYLWSTNLKTTAEALPNFYKLRTELSNNGFSKESHYLIAIGKQHNKSFAYLGSFHKDSDLRELLDSDANSESKLSALQDKIKNRYAYFYIPVETDPITFSKLESTHVQKLLDEDIQTAIQKAVGHNTINKINNELNDFVTQINTSLVEYTYRGTYKDRLTMNDLVEKIFEAYFSIKVLHKNTHGSSIPIREMSAGEKRKALIDLSYSLLKRREARKHQIILAIDEPDASLHASACHDLFSRLAAIPALTNPRSQVLLTTHWYGFLPIVQNGIAHSISRTPDKIEFFSFDLYNFREQIRRAVKDSHGELPRDIELKSYNDMLQSIVSSTVKSTPYNWILCEGLSDKIYLEYYLADLIEKSNLRIIPLGGFKEVRRAFSYLKTPLDDPEYKVTGKVLCLVDTDAQLEQISSKPESKAIEFLRLIFDSASSGVKIVKIDDQLVSPATEIEHALDGVRFVETAKTLGDENGGNILKEISSNAKFVEASQCVYGYLDLSPSVNKKMMEKFFDVADNKVKFAVAYTKLPNEIGKTPDWILEIKNHFSVAKKPKK